jgi:hypothetical protein
MGESHAAQNARALNRGVRTHMGHKKGFDRKDTGATGETEMLDDIEPTQTIQLGEEYRASIVAAHEGSAGRVTHDARGHAQWKWTSQEHPVAPNDKTYNLLKALDNDALAVREAAQAAEQASRKIGFDPYDTARTRKPKT